MEPTVAAQVVEQVVAHENMLEWTARFMVEGGVFMWIILRMVRGYRHMF